MLHHIMVTSFNGHWNNIANNYTGFSSPMLKFKLNGNASPATNLPVIFIKRVKDGAVQKAWLGRVSNFEKKPYKDISKWWFNVHIEREIDCPMQFTNHKEGWYLEDVNELSFANNKSSYKSDYEIFKEKYYPQFFSTISTTTDWQEFEELSYALLKLLGIHELHQYDRRNQKGKADGVFKIDNTVVIYDCTLDTDFAATKAQQINNYCNLLNGNRIELEGKTWNISNCDKFVWIIGRWGLNNNSNYHQVDDVIVKIVDIFDLFRIYQDRLQQNLNEKQLEKFFHEL